MNGMARIKAAIFISVFVSYLGLSVMLPVLAPIVRELGLTESQAGWMVSIGSIAMAAMAPFWGRLSDRIGRKPVMLIGLVGLGVGYGLFTGFVYAGFNELLGATMVFVLLVLSRSLIGVFIPAVPSSAQAYIADVTEAKDRASGIAMIGAANGLGLVFGPAIAGALAVVGLIWPLALGALLPLIALVIVSVVIVARPPVARGTAAAAASASSGRSRGVLPYLAIGFIMMLAIVTIQINSGFYMQDRLGLTTDETARLLAVSLTFTGVALLVVQVAQMKLLRWQPRRMILTGIPLAVVGMSILMLTESAWTYGFAFFLTGAGAGFVLPGYASGASLAVSADRQGAVAGWTGAVQGLAAIVAPLGSTVLYEMQHSLPFWLTIGLLAACGLLYAWRGAYVDRKVPSVVNYDK